MLSLRGSVSRDCLTAADSLLLFDTRRASARYDSAVRRFLYLCAAAERVASSCFRRWALPTSPGGQAVKRVTYAPEPSGAGAHGRIEAECGARDGEARSSKETASVLYVNALLLPEGGG